MINWDEVEEEASRMLSVFIKKNTSNPPGNEMDLIRILENICKNEKLYYKIYETAPNRGNIIISLDDTFQSSEIFLSHLDVVSAQEEEWEYNPFSGIIKDGFIHGRGALDTKQLTVMQLMVMILIKRHNLSNENIIMIATSDEERGSNFGFKKFLEENKTLFKDSYIISEGGGFPIRINGKIVYLIESGQKGHGHIKIWFEKEKLDNPYYKRNSNLKKCTKLIERIAELNWKTEIPKNTLELINNLFELCEVENKNIFDIDEKIELIKKNGNSFIGNMLNSMINNTFTITIWKAGKDLDIENETYFEIDVRTLPDVNQDMVAEKIEELIKDTDAKYEIITFNKGFKSSTDNKLFDIFEEEIKKIDSKNLLLPFVSSGGSDGRFLENYSSTVYGFSPTVEEDSFDKIIPLVHGCNERISKESLVFGIKILLNSFIKLKK